MIAPADFSVPPSPNRLESVRRAGFAAAVVGAVPEALADTDKSNAPASSSTIIDFERTLKRERFEYYGHPKVDILKDGCLDIPNNILDKLDVVGASIHSNFSLSKEIQTERLIKAAKNPSVDIIFHPTGRLINKREGYSIDIEKLIDTACETRTILEINSNYNRLDLRDEHIRLAVNNGVKLAINSDAHHPIHFAYLLFGVGQARRGWAEKIDVINSSNVDDLLKRLK